MNLYRTFPHNLLKTLVSGAGALAILTSPLHAELEDINPADIFMTIYYKEQSANTLTSEENYAAAIADYQEAQRLLNGISLYHASWRPENVRKANARVKRNIEKIRKIQRDRALGIPTKPDISLTPSSTTTGGSLPDVDTSDLDTISAMAETKKRLEDELKKEKLKTATRGELVEMVSRLQSEKDILEGSVKAGEESNKRQVTMLQKEITRITEQLNSPLNSFESINKDKEIEELQKRLNAAEKSNARLRLEKEAQKKVAAEAEAKVAILSRSSQDSASAAKEADQRLAEINQKLEVLTNQKEEAEERLKVTLQKLEKSGEPSNLVFQGNMSNQIDTLKADRDKIIEKQKTLNEQKELEIAVLKGNKKELEVALAHATAQLAEANKSLSETTEKLELNQKSINSGKSELFTVVSKKADPNTAEFENPRVAQLEEEIKNLNQQLDLLATRPTQSDLAEIKDELDTVKQEKGVLITTLSENEKTLEEYVDRINILQTQLEETVAKAVEESKFASQEKLTEEAIRERVMEQNSKLRESLTQIQRELASSKAEVEKLTLHLRESKEAYADLQGRYDSLVIENQNFRNMLNGNLTADQIRLKSVEMETKYKEMRKKYQAVLAENTQNEEELQTARKEYAGAKLNLSKARQAIDQQLLVSEKLRGQLTAARHTLALAEQNPNSDYDSDEVELLREIIDKQIKLQNNRNRAFESLIAQVSRLDIEDESLLATLSLFETQELILTEREMKLVNEGRFTADGIFESPVKPSLAVRAEAEAKLNKIIRFQEEMGQENFQKGRYIAAQQHFEANLDKHPGHIPSMLNLGVCRVLHGKKHQDVSAIDEAIESFQDAVAISGDQKLPYAHQMLGYCYYEKGELSSAEAEFMTSLTINPDNAVPHIYLASIASESNDMKGAEKHLKSAIKADSSMLEPHYNLALLYKNQGKYEQAWKHYKEAHKRGAKPDSILEGAIKKALPDRF